VSLSRRTCDRVPSVANPIVKLMLRCHDRTAAVVEAPSHEVVLAAVGLTACPGTTAASPKLASDLGALSSCPSAARRSHAQVSCARSTRDTSGAKVAAP
jgi:hypothetical protein